jgi:hypothetical protein
MTTTKTETIDTDLHALVCLAIGRILRLGSRPTEPGDVQEYERCRQIVMDAVDPVVSR